MAASSTPEQILQPLQPYLAFRDARAAIAFYESAFGAEELYRLPMPDGKIAHAELRIGEVKIMLSEEWPEQGAFSAEHYGGTPISLCIYVRDVDSIITRAQDAGATVLRPVADQFYGDRSGTIKDPFGYKWTFSTHKEDVSPDEMNRRMQSLFATQA